VNNLLLEDDTSVLYFNYQKEAFPLLAAVNARLHHQMLYLK